MFSESTILVVSGKSDEPETVARMLADQYRVIESESVDEALANLSNGVDVALADLESAKNDGLELLRKGKARHPDTPIVVVTHDGDVNVAVEAMKLGAADCIAKPVNRDKLRSVVAELIERRRSNRAGSDAASRGEWKNTSNIDIPPGTSLEDLERAAVEQALAEHHGNRTHAAKTLGISVRTLQRKLKAWGMPVGPLQNSSSPTANFGLPAHSGHGGHSAYSAHAH
ncbi:MAG: response regulator [Pirellulales bacterium]